MSPLQIQPKPGFWIPGPASIDPHYREYWDDLYCFLPFEEVRPGDNPLGSSSEPPVNRAPTFGWVDWAYIDVPGGTMHVTYETTEIGLAAVFPSDIESGEGYYLDDKETTFDMSGTKSDPAAMGLVFKWDGTTGAGRALVAQGGATDFQIRIRDEASPASLEDTTALVEFATDAIVANDWIALVIHSHPVATSTAYFNVGWRNLHTGATGYTENVQMTAGERTDYFSVGRHASFANPAVGVSFAGLWLWYGIDWFNNTDRFANFWDKDKTLKFLKDPFAMYRPYPIATVATASAPGGIIIQNA